MADGAQGTERKSKPTGEAGRSLRVAGLVYALAGGKVKAALVEQGTWRWWTLGAEADFLQDAVRLRDEVANVELVAGRRLRRLETFAGGWGRELIPEPVLENPPDVLVLVPQGFLHRLPLHLAFAEDERALGWHSGVAYSSSLTTFCRSATRNRAPRERRGRDRLARGGGSDVSGRAQREFDGLSEFVLDNFAATGRQPPDRAKLSRRAVRLALGDVTADVVCIVAHGFTDPYRHRSSGLLVDGGDRLPRVLDVYGRAMSFPDLPLRDLPMTARSAGADGSKESALAPLPGEILTLGELELTTPIETELVLLLACSAGASEVLQGDEPASLAEAVLRLGAGSVVAPMWDCDVQLAEGWMRGFMRAWLEEDAPKAIAGRSALRELGDGTDPAALSPLHLRGDWQ
jgi:CHAT domain-containing protein